MSFPIKFLLFFIAMPIFSINDAQRLYSLFIENNTAFSRAYNEATPFERTSLCTLMLSTQSALREDMQSIQNISSAEAQLKIENLFEEATREDKLLLNIPVTSDGLNLIMVAFFNKNLKIATILARSSDLDLSFKNRAHQRLEDMIMNCSYRNKREWVGFIETLKMSQLQRQTRENVRPRAHHQAREEITDRHDTISIHYSPNYESITRRLLQLVFEILNTPQGEFFEAPSSRQTSQHSGSETLLSEIQKLREDVEERNEIINALLRSNEQPQDLRNIIDREHQEDVQDLLRVKDNEIHLLEVELRGREAAAIELLQYKEKCEKYEQELSPRLYCQICLEFIESELERALPSCQCSTLAFHKNCLQRWQTSHSNVLSCPQCRTTGPMRIFR